MTPYAWDWNPETRTVRLAPQAVTLGETLAVMDDAKTTHTRLVAAGWRWDTLDGYTAPDAAAYDLEVRRAAKIESLARAYAAGQEVTVKWRKDTDEPEVTWLGAYTPEDRDPLMTWGQLARAVGAGVVVASATVALLLVLL